MRTILGIWPLGSRCELSPGRTADPASRGGLHAVVLPHTSRAPSAAALLEHYRPGDPTRLRRYAEDCAFIVHDEEAKSLTLARDAFGTTPLYYIADKHGFAFATRIADLLHAWPGDVAPNRHALAALLVDHDAPTAAETFFTNIRALPPGEVLTYTPGRVRVFAADATSPEQSSLSYADTVARFTELFRDAVRVRVESTKPTGVLVSGGLDSAAILCMAASAGDVFGLTYGLQDGGVADESRYTDALRDAGLRVERVAFYPTTDVDGIEQSVIEGETPAIDQVTLTLARAAARTREAGAQALLLGTWGDQVLAPFPPPHIARVAPWRTGELGRLARAYQQYMTDVDTADIYEVFVRRSLRRRAPGWWIKRRRNNTRLQSRYDMLAREFGPPPMQPQPRTFGEAVWSSATSRRQLQAVEGTTKWGTANGLDVGLPFLDVPLVRFLASVPDAHAYHANALKPLLRDALKDVVPPLILERRDKGDYTEAIAQGLPHVNAMLDRLGDLSELVDFGLMSPASAAKTLAHLSKPTEITDQVHQIAQLMGVSAWLRRFFLKP